MRSSTMWMLAGTAVFAVACVTGGAAAQEEAGAPAGAAAATAVTETTRRDVEVMRRVLVKEGLGTTPDSVRTDARDVSVQFWATVPRPSPSDAYVIAGDGVTFVLRTSDPVAPSRGAQKETAGTTDPSAWEQAEAEMEGRQRAQRVRSRADRYDAGKVDALRTRVLEQLARYGSRIRGLASTDHLTVVVEGGGPYSLRLNDRLITTTDAAGNLDVAALDRPRAVTALGYVTGAAGADASTVLTIRVSLADCQAFARNELDLDTFRRRAVISAY